MKYLLLVILFIGNIYSPYGTLVMVAINIFFTIISFFHCYHIKSITKIGKTIIFLCFIILYWTILVIFFHGHINQSRNFHAIGRHGLNLLNTILLSIIIRNIKISSFSFFLSLGITLLLNVLIVYIQTLFPSSKDLFRNSTGYDKGILLLRSFGLYASYDACGLNICIGMVFWGILYYYYRKIIYILLFFITFFSTALVSRYSMVIAAVIFLFFLIRILSINKMKKRVLMQNILIFIIALFMGFTFYVYVTPILRSDLSVGGYHSGSMDALLDTMLFLPDDIFSIFIGEGIDPLSDIGYVKYIFIFGLVGLIMILYLYIYCIVYLRKIIRKLSITLKEIHIIYWILFFSMLLIFAFNYKLQLLYMKNFHSLFIIMVFILNKYCRQFINSNNISCREV